MSEPDERFQELVARVRETRIENKEAQRAVEDAERRTTETSAAMLNAWEDLQRYIDTTIDEPMTLMEERIRESRGVAG